MKNKRILSFSLLTLALVFVFALSPAAVMADADGQGHFFGYKFASKHTIGPDDSLTYTVLLYNSSISTITANVVDELPTEFTYKVGSASEGGVYDETLHTLTWTAIDVDPATQVLLTFDMMSPEVVRETGEVVNTATITTDQSVSKTEATVNLVSSPPVIDAEYPVVESVVISDADVLTSRDVTIYTEATDNVGVETMLIKEWQSHGNGQSDWEVVNSEGWVPYEASHEYTLNDVPGVHFIGVWVADAEGNISHATQQSFDYASYLEAQTIMTDGIGMLPYAVYYDENVDATATLTHIIGDGFANLYIWFPGNYDFTAPDLTAVDPDLDPLTFKTETAGTYIFAVGYQSDVTYNLAITPGGGPSAWNNEVMLVENASVNTEAATVSIFGEIGLDPIAQAIEDQPLTPNVPTAPNQIHLPMVWR
jgi:uncharacterized repeat protein (TIGR01451 family)